MTQLLRDLAPGDAGWILQRHAEHYTATQGFDPSFEAIVARILPDFIDKRDPSTDRAWIATAPDGTRQGSILCAKRDAETAQLRLFFVEPQCQGQGLGKRLLWACIAHARAQGFRDLVLWTHAEQRAACALYARAGFTLASSERGQSFGVEALVQHFRLDLRHADTALLQ